MTQRFVTMMAICLVSLAAGNAFAQGLKTWTEGDIVVHGLPYKSSDAVDHVKEVVVFGADIFVAAPSGVVTDKQVTGTRSKTDLIEITYKGRTFFAEAFAFSFSEQELTIEGVSVSPNLEN